MSEIIETKFAETTPETDIKEIIIIKQLPVMEERFQEISDEIKNRLSIIETLEVSEDTKSQVKKTLAEFRKEFEIFEERRKQVKAEINKPYDEINELYKTYVEQPYKSAFNDLSAKIVETESRQKNRLLDEAAKYFIEYKAGLSLTFPAFDSSKFTINLNTTMKNLREQIKKYLDSIKRDIDSIATMGDRTDDIMIEYKRILDLSAAIKTINERAKEKMRYEAEKVKAAEVAEQQLKIEEKVDEAISKSPPEPVIVPAQEITPPKTEDTEQEIKTFTFWAEVTREKFDKLIKFMKDEGIKYGKHTGA